MQPSRPSDIRLCDLRPLFIESMLNLVEDSQRGYFQSILESTMKLTDLNARIDELCRIRGATLDADEDVWSLTDDGQLISLLDRLYYL